MCFGLQCYANEYLKDFIFLLFISLNPLFLVLLKDTKILSICSTQLILSTKLIDKIVIFVIRTNEKDDENYNWRPLSEYKTCSHQTQSYFETLIISITVSILITLNCWIMNHTMIKELFEKCCLLKTRQYCWY